MNQSLSRRLSNWYSRPCDICGEQKKIALLGRRQFHVPTQRFIFEMEFEDSVCEECGFVFAARIPEENFLNDYYQSAHTAHSSQVKFVPDFQVTARLTLIKSLVPPNATIYELGANDGTFVDALNESGFAACGVDPLASHKNNAVTGDYVTANGRPSADTYDAVVSYYVLEHVTRPVSWLRSSVASLKPGGIIIVEVPDFAAYPEISLEHEHLSHFTPEHLEAAFIKANVNPLYVGHEHRSRFFGVVGVARNEPPTQALDKSAKIDEMIYRARDCYRRAHDVAVAESARLQGLIEYLVEAYHPVQYRAIYVWAANEHATRLGRILKRNGIYGAKILDNADSKIGQFHDGFETRIERPNLIAEKKEEAIFLLCSPAWNQSIENQIREAKLTCAVIVDVIKWRREQTLLQ